MQQSGLGIWWIDEPLWTQGPMLFKHVQNSKQRWTQQTILRILACPIDSICRCVLWRFQMKWFYCAVTWNLPMCASENVPLEKDRQFHVWNLWYRAIKNCHFWFNVLIFEFWTWWFKWSFLYRATTTSTSTTGASLICIYIYICVYIIYYMYIGYLSFFWKMSTLISKWSLQPEK